MPLPETDNFSKGSVVKIRMLTTAASPERILEAGRIYDLPVEEAELFLREGNPVPGLPCAVRVKADAPVSKPQLIPKEDQIPRFSDTIEQFDLSEEEAALEEAAAALDAGGEAEPVGTKAGKPDATKKR
jgi:hypothetical protein